MVLITGREKTAARSVLIGAGFNVAINLWVVPHYGVFLYPGSAVMTVLTEVVLVGGIYLDLIAIAAYLELDQHPDPPFTGFGADGHAGRVPQVRRAPAARSVNRHGFLLHLLVCGWRFWKGRL